MKAEREEEEVDEEEEEEEQRGAIEIFFETQTHAPFALRTCTPATAKDFFIPAALAISFLCLLEYIGACFLSSFTMSQPALVTT